MNFPTIRCRCDGPEVKCYVFWRGCLYGTVLNSDFLDLKIAELIYFLAFLDLSLEPLVVDVGSSPDPD